MFSLVHTRIFSLDALSIYFMYILRWFIDLILSQWTNAPALLHFSYCDSMESDSLSNRAILASRYSVGHCYWSANSLPNHCWASLFFCQWTSQLHSSVIELNQSMLWVHFAQRATHGTCISTFHNGHSRTCSFLSARYFSLFMRLYTMRSGHGKCANSLFCFMVFVFKSLKSHCMQFCENFCLWAFQVRALAQLFQIFCFIRLVIFVCVPNDSLVNRVRLWPCSCVFIFIKSF